MRHAPPVLHATHARHVRGLDRLHLARIQMPPAPLRGRTLGRASHTRVAPRAHAAVLDRTRTSLLLRSRSTTTRQSSASLRIRSYRIVPSIFYRIGTPHTQQPERSLHVVRRALGAGGCGPDFAAAARPSMVLLTHIAPQPPVQISRYVWSCPLESVMPLYFNVLRSAGTGTITSPFQ